VTFVWFNVHFTSSAAVIIVCATVVRQYVKNPHLRFLPVTYADFLRKIYLQFTRCNIRTSAVKQNIVCVYKEYVLYCVA